jgi:hypothetical protein
MNRATWIAVVVLLVLLPLAAVPFLGWWLLALPGLALLLLAAGRLPRRDGGGWEWAAVATGLLGGGIGVASAAGALLEVGRVAPYSGRAGFGWAALALAGLAMTGAALAPTRHRLAAGLLALGSTAGTAAMAVFWINSWYLAALPLCWLAAALALLRPRGATPAPQLQPRG